MLLRRCCPSACPSCSAVGSSKRVTISFSGYYLVTRPFRGAIKCLKSWRRHRSSSSSWHPRRRLVASSREVERRRTGQIRLAYQLPMCAAVHLRPSLPQNNSENVWELEAFELQLTTNLYKLANEQLWIGVVVQCRPRRHFLYARCHRQPSMRNSSYRNRFRASYGANQQDWPLWLRAAKMV